MDKKIFSKITSYLPQILALLFIAGFAVYAWQEPSQAPPGGNVPAPLNVGPTGQSKEGGLILNTGGAIYGLIIDKGISEFGGSVIFKPINRPVSPEEGQTYFDQGDKNMYYYNGTDWVIIGREIIPTCGVCKTYDSQTEQCVNLPAGTRGVGCQTLHYACNGAGSCTAPTTQTTVTASGVSFGSPSGSQICTGHDGCGSCSMDGGGYLVGCTPSSDCDTSCYEDATVSCACFDWVYD